MLACIDGIVNKIDPINEGYWPYNKNFLEDKKIYKIQFLPRKLNEAIDALELNNDLLKRGGVFRWIIETMVKHKQWRNLFNWHNAPSVWK